MITLYTAVTLDGFIAAEDGNVDFLENPSYKLPDEDYGYAGFYEEIDVVVMGYNTYNQVVNFEGEYPYKGKHSVVFSRTENTDTIGADIEITERSESEVVQALKKQGKNVWIIGGGATNARIHQSGLIDKMILTYLPITLGKGIPLFRDNSGNHVWKNTGTRTFANGLVQITLVRK